MDLKEKGKLHCIGWVARNRENYNVLVGLKGIGEKYLVLVELQGIETLHCIGWVVRHRETILYWLG